jgi:SSS family solute:Na+ symporter
VSAALVFAFAGIVLIGVLGFLGRRKPTAEITEWTVGGRRFGALTMWFLQAGEIFTTFTFLGMAGLAFSGGVAATYALPYVPLGYLLVFFLARRLWNLGRRNGYLTQGDFLQGRYDSRLLGTLAAVLGVVFVLPYLQLQITGLGLIVKLVTGDATSSNVSMIVGCVLVVAFVLWSGMRGVATTSYFKDVIMLIALLLILVMVPAHFHGGISGIFQRIQQLHPSSLIVHAGSNDHTWYFTSMLVSAIGVGFMTLPHTWPALMSARDPRVLRRNYIWIPLYEVLLLVPMLVGFAAVLVLAKGSNSNAILLTLSKQLLPPWALGLIVVAGIATAMVPAAGILIGISSLVARNIARVRTDRQQVRVNHLTVVVACGLALLLGIFRPGLLANLLLLTYSGTVQLAPGNGLAFLRKVPVGKAPVLAGLIVGEIVVIWLTFWETDLFGTFNVGLVGLGANLVVLAIGAGIERLAAARAPQPEPGSVETAG